MHIVMLLIIFYVSKLSFYDSLIVLSMSLAYCVSASIAHSLCLMNSVRKSAMHRVGRRPNQHGIREAILCAMDVYTCFHPMDRDDSDADDDDNDDDDNDDDDDR